ncbi:2-amino-4-hydroxy-6-hydroxymethyldihydropteridine pyrophosphokinase [Aquisphaera giovannonii]|uniref:2-amino-4-hydroxy-6-hydroxymethyldihydropteridine pyrophosphokinase n=1 Tax=Aquisphaera giovannonii TaxID=406548 RepID=A0A5B9VZD3_9BACT|nr:2-amino-4-hydroxy-6-hydroxymethyldihydropteridine diphosphokinase [Aquisphaera giovannonii]QEH33030.1 2-amino-4-hydroxy-6-hydroxymethyldihydropteridine pyrophosphokinase [Aquisphaera giovannonii]
MGTPAYIGMGSNLGDRRAILDAAVESLGRLPGSRVSAVSRYYETAPVGGPPDQGPFLNAAAALETTLEPLTLLAGLQEIETKAGRVRVVRWGERTLDLDLLLFGGTVLDTPTLSVPHPWMAVRRFVLAPLCEIAPDRVDPVTGTSVQSLLENLERRPSLVCLGGCWRDGVAAWRSAFERVVRALNAHVVSLGDPFLSRDTARGRLISLRNLAQQLEWWKSDGDRWIVADFSPADFAEDAERRRIARLSRRRAVRVRSLLRPTIVVQRAPTSANSIRRLGIREDGVPTLLLASDSPDELSERMIDACNAARSPATVADASRVPPVLRYDAAE